MTPDDYTLGALHCSFTDKGAYTDAITNVSSLGAPLSVIDTEPLLRPGKLPKSLVLDFVHEATHQWCFHSTVGNAITYLAGRTSCPIYFKNPVLAEEINLQPDTWDVDDDGLDFPELGLFREDMIRVETATGILRPLAEGLAMFAELDATTNPDSDYAPMPLLSLPMSFGDFESVADLDDPQMISTKLIRDVLHSSRLSPDGLDRRMRLLTQPFEHRAGGYLPGYLAIKQLWVSVGLRDSSDLHNADSGLFLGYARSFFYDDYGLVNVLLNPATEDVDSYLAISEYLKNRVLVFLDNVTDQDIRAYERNVLPDEFGHVDPLTRARYIHTGEQEYQAGRRLLEKAYSWLDGQDGGELENKARLVVRDVMSQRDHMYIGNARGFMKVDEEGVRVGDASGTLTIPKLSFSPPKLGQSGPCRITIFYFTSDGYHRRIIGLSQENENWAGAHIPRLANGELEIEDDLLDKLAAYPALTLSRRTYSEVL